MAIVKVLTSEGLEHLVTVVKTVKADIDSPSFTGEPLATTAQTSDSSTRIATTEFVHSAAQKEIEDARHTLTFGKYSYDGSQDVSVDNYEGNYDISQ